MMELRSNHLQVIALLFACTWTTVQLEEYPKCNVKLDISVCFTEEPPANSTTKEECARETICRKNFNITYVKVEPYSTLIVSDILRRCCGHCAVSNEINSLTKISQLSEAIMKDTHFVFPVLGRRDTTRLYDHHFIPIIETPNVYYVTYKKHNVLKELVVSCLDMWPLMIICMLMVMISGFLCWLTETWGNENEFPRTFLKGWFEGIWWSFISMTTVGYGDKCPKSIPARIFSIIWIVIGITTFSLVTAMLTSEISAANSQPPPTMENANVGVIRHRIYESILIANQGGIIVDIDPVNITDGIHELTHMLKNDEIDGFVLDRYTLMLFYNIFENDTRHSEDIQFIRKSTILTEVTHVEQFLYGILVKYREDYEYLVDFMTSNRDVINTCSSVYLNNLGRQVKVQQERHALFSIKGQMFWPTFISCIIILAVICLFGLVYRLNFKDMEKNICNKRFLMG